MTRNQRTVSPAGTLPRLIGTAEAAELLQVDQRTITNWIKKDAIPYVKLPDTGERTRYRIPLQGLLNTLSGNYDLAGDLKRLDSAMEDASGTSRAEILAKMRAGEQS